MEEKQDIKLQTQVYNIDKDQQYLEIKIDMEQYENSQKNNDTGQQQEKHFLVVIDRSGSMSGTYINNTLKVTQLFVDYILKSFKLPKISLICFDHEIEVHMNLEKLSKSQISDTIQGIRARGGTSFVVAQQEISKYINNTGCNDLSILFLTDGCGTTDKQTFQNLQKTAKNKVQSLEVHTVGLGSGHNVSILDDMLQLKTTRGTYQFIQDIEDINVCFQAIRETMGETFYKFKLRNKKHQNQFVNFDRVGQQSQFNKLITIDQLIQILNCKDKNQLQDLNLEIYQGEKLIFTKYLKIFQVDPISLIDKESENYDLSLKVTMEVKVLENRIDEILQNFQIIIKDYQNPDNQKQISHYSKIVIPELKNTGSIIGQRLFRQKINNKDQLFDILGRQTEKIGKIEDSVFQIMNNQISNTLIAQVSAMSYTNIQNKVFQKRLQNRFKSSNEQFDNYKKQIQVLSQESQAKEDELNKQYEKINDEYSCFLSCQNMVESLIDEDCLCFTFSVKRSELSIVRPECLKVTNIYPTIVSAKSFIMAVQHAIKISPENTGGFNKKEGNIVKGVAQEEINAAFPIFLNKDHWKIGKLWLEPILGWVTTLNVMGYHHTQKRTVPFLLFDKIYQLCLENPKQEFYQKSLSSIKETCLHILHEDSESQVQQLNQENSQTEYKTMKEEVLALYKEIMDGNMTKANPINLININIFLVKLYLLEVEISEQFFQIIIQECFRRKLQIDVTNNQISELIQYKSEPTVKQYQQYYIDLIQSNSMDSIFSYLQNLLNKIYDDKQGIKYSLDITISNLKPNTFNKILKLKSNDNFICLFGQNILHKPDKVRNNAVTCKEYKNPWDDKCVEEFFENAKYLQQNDIFNKHYSQMDAKPTKAGIQGSFHFQQPPIPGNLKGFSHILSSCIYKKSDFEELLNRMKPFKSNARWYFWVLVANDAIGIEDKVMHIYEKFGTVKKITNYHHYIFGKAGILSSNILNTISA